MSFLPNPIACDVCGIVKGQANHWYYSFDTTIATGFMVYRWDTEAENRNRPELVHLCGQVCVGKKLSEWMG